MKKLGLICLVIILSIGCLGTAYARWRQSLADTTLVNTGNWTKGQFLTAHISSGTSTVDSYPVAGAFPAGTIIINGNGPKDNDTSFNSTISYTIVNNGSIPIKINTITVSISGTMGNLHVYDTTSGDPLGNFNYTNASSGGIAGGITSSNYIAPILVGSGNTVSGIISLSAPAGSGVNGKNCEIEVTFTSKVSTQ
jgi:hypothetical protein